MYVLCTDIEGIDMSLNKICIKIEEEKYFKVAQIGDVALEIRSCRLYLALLKTKKVLVPLTHRAKGDCCPSLARLGWPWISLSIPGGAWQDWVGAGWQGAGWKQERREQWVSSSVPGRQSAGAEQGAVQVTLLVQTQPKR